LTVAGVDVAAGTFDVALIPTTLELTTLGDLEVGGRCNLETDILARTVIHYLRHFKPSGR
jgi:riboflavin synthase